MTVSRQNRRIISPLATSRFQTPHFPRYTNPHTRVRPRAPVQPYRHRPVLPHLSPGPLANRSAYPHPSQIQKPSGKHERVRGTIIRVPTYPTSRKIWTHVQNDVQKGNRYPEGRNRGPRCEPASTVLTVGIEGAEYPTSRKPAPTYRSTVRAGEVCGGGAGISVSAIRHAGPREASTSGTRHDWRAGYGRRNRRALRGARETLTPPDMPDPVLRRLPPHRAPPACNARG